jgi:hypothetical protein
MILFRTFGSWPGHIQWLRKYQQYAIELRKGCSFTLGFGQHEVFMVVLDDRMALTKLGVLVRERDKEKRDIPGRHNLEIYGECPD